MYYHTYRGWQVKKTDENGRSLYLKRVYKGEPEWVTDYMCAKGYTEETAKKYNDEFAGDAPTDSWLIVLEDRVSEWSSKEETHRKGITKAIDDFKEWISKADECDILYDIEYYAKTITEAKTHYETAWNNLCIAKHELAAYKETTNH